MPTWWKLWQASTRWKATSEQQQKHATAPLKKGWQKDTFAKGLIWKNSTLPLKKGISICMPKEPLEKGPLKKGVQEFQLLPPLKKGVQIFLKGAATAGKNTG